MKNRSLILLSILLVCLVTVFTFSCGGSSGSSSDSGTSGTTPGQSPATIDQDAVESTYGLAMIAGDMSDSSKFATQNFGSTATGCAGFGGINIVKPVLDMILNAESGYQSLGGSSDTINCSTSGSSSISLTWDGPDTYDDCDEISNMGGTIVFNDCVMGTISIKGQVTFSSTGPGCQPDSITITYTDFQVDNPDDNLQVSTKSFTIVMSNFVWSEGEITAVTMVLNGTINAVVNGENYSVTCDNYTIVMTATATGVRLKVSGRITGPCLDGWVTLETIDEIIVDEDADCPTGGKIKVIGDRESYITFHSNGSVDIDGHTYSSCNDINRGCEN